MSASPSDRRYATSHEWHKLEGDVVVIGISQHAVDELTDITYVEIDDPEGRVRKGSSFGEIESVKATSELYSGIDGQIVAVNTAVSENPALINDDCYNAAWLIKVKPDDPAQLDDLLDAQAYDAQSA